MKKGQAQFIAEIIIAIVLLVITMIGTSVAKGAEIGEIKADIQGGRIDSDLITILNSKIDLEIDSLEEITVLDAIKITYYDKENPLTGKIDKELIKALKPLKNKIYLAGKGYEGFKLTAFYPDGTQRELIASSYDPTKSKIFQIGEVSIKTENGEILVKLEVGLNE